MSNLRTITAFGLCGIAALASSKGPIAEWQKRYDKVSKMVIAGDFKSFQDLMAENYVWVLPDGKQKNRKESIAEFAPLFKMKEVSGGETVKKVTGNGEAVEVTFYAKWTMVGKDGKAIHDQERGIDSWRKIGGQWKVIRTVDKPAKR
ncbi:MAG: nuclear transport factor 2 family protein [Fimbriimonas sp.]|nr:nuclear transport factor 2 family protein [Fimbriimonas sp.]